MKSICVVLLFSLFAVAVCQDGCCVPEKLTATVGVLQAEVVDGVPRTFLGAAFLSMDETIRKINYEIVFLEQKEFNGRMLLDYTTKTRYMVRDGKCMKSQLGDWKRNCLTKNDSSLVANMYVGSGTNTLDGSTYYIKLKGTGDAIVYVTVTRENPCVPIGEVAFGNLKGGVPFAMTLGFSNITRSVPDPSVFDIPDICKTAPTIPQELSSFGGSYLFR